MTEPLESHLLGQVSEPRIGFWHEVRALTVLDQVPVGRPVEVVDIGAGAGLLGAILERERPEATYRFFEPIESIAEALALRYGADARLPRVEDCGSADVVALLDVIEHVEHEAELLGPVLGGTSRGTTVVLTAPALSILWSSWDEQLGHYRRYTTKSLRRALEEFPLEQVRVDYLFPELVAPGLVRRLARRRSDEGADVGDADFPVLPPALDTLLRTIGRLTYRARRWWPIGSSVAAVGRRI